MNLGFNTTEELMMTLSNTRSKEQFNIQRNKRKLRNLFNKFVSFGLIGGRKWCI
ncbi:MAG: hypothetical protein ACTS4W_01175 [Candidatus Hodgkinia cicadicola]